MVDTAAGRVLVQAVSLDDSRHIGFRSSRVAEDLHNRLDDIEHALRSSVGSIAKTLPDLTSPAGWHISEISAAFGITLAAEAGVIVSKASGEATFEVSVSFTPCDDSEPDGHGDRSDPPQ
jgi:hypothetical protein